MAIYLSWFNCGASDIQTFKLSYKLVFHAGDQWIQVEIKWWKKVSRNWYWISTNTKTHFSCEYKISFS